MGRKYLHEGTNMVAEVVPLKLYQKEVDNPWLRKVQNADSNLIIIVALFAT